MGRYINAPFASLGSSRAWDRRGLPLLRRSGAAICHISAEISTGGLVVGRFLLLFFLTLQDQAQDVTLVSSTGDGGEKCLGNHGSFHAPGGGTEDRERKRKEKRKEAKEGKPCRKDGLELAGVHHPLPLAPQEAAAAQETGLQGPQVTSILSPVPIFTPPSRSASTLPLTFLSGMPNVKHS